MTRAPTALIASSLVRSLTRSPGLGSLEVADRGKVLHHAHEKSGGKREVDANVGIGPFGKDGREHTNEAALIV